MGIFAGKNILLGVSGSIAAYKAVQLASDLTKAGAQVHVLMTHAATQFVGALTFQTITHNTVYTEVFQGWTQDWQGHISLAENADVAVVAPASVDIIAKLAHGFSDDIIATTFVASPAPVVVAPAMDHHMFMHPATQANLKTLEERGATIVWPQHGRLASGRIGEGRLAEQGLIMATIGGVLARGGELAGRHVVVTAAGTHEPIDPVRFIGNRSSGQMGYAIAQAALDRGARVSLITGPSALVPPGGATIVRVETAADMEKAVREAVGADGSEAKADALIMAAAVADFRPVTTGAHKIKKEALVQDGEEGEAVLRLELTTNPDILGGLAAWTGKMVRIGFAAETDDLTENAQRKLTRKNLDLIVANEAVASIGANESAVTFIERSGLITQLPRQPKEVSAERIMDKVVQLLSGLNQKESTDDHD